MSTRTETLRSLAAEHRRGGSSAIETATALVAVARGFAEVAAADTVSNVTPAELADALAISGYTAKEVAPALKVAFSSLSALEVGQLLQGVYKSPPITTAEMSDALAAASYSAADVSAAVKALYPSPVSYRKEGPAGPADGDMFDDGPAAEQLGQPITKIIVRHGEIIDSIQAFIGATALPHHGGHGGGATTFTLEPGDVLSVVFGFVGSWFGRHYVLQLTLESRQGRRYGPFGTMNNASGAVAFIFKAGAGEIAAFWGHDVPGVEADGSWTRFVTSLGVVIKEGG